MSKESDILGMSMGSASNKLKNSIIFNFAERLGENTCFVCSRPIDTVGELSIEHKQPWLSRGKEWFFDLDNIAFSHRSCNRAYRDTLLRYDSNAQTFRCKKCETVKPVSEFHKDDTHQLGFRYSCRTCRK